ncbi:MAG: PhoH family protein [Planctomycetota bacterium]
MEETIRLRSTEEERLLFGQRDRNLKRLRDRYTVDVWSREGLLHLKGAPEAVSEAKDLIERVLAGLRSGRRDGAMVLDELLGEEPEPTELPGLRRGPADNSFLVRPKTGGQKLYLESIRKNPIVFAIGPAGTGKTYLAVSMAVAALKRGEFRRLVLTRPAVEAGERLGFLPGDLIAKVNPYLRPLYDALNDLLGPPLVKKYLENDVIEIVPLAYMRGRTLNHAFIILDEAQNATTAQMKMFLTRMGSDSRIVVTGDITQVDLPDARSGLIDAEHVLRDIRGIDFVRLGKRDIVRHPLVQAIVDAYERDQPEEQDGGDGGRSRPRRRPRRG